VRFAPLLLALSVLVAAGCEETREESAKASAPIKQPLRPDTGTGRDLAWLSRLRRWELRFDRQAFNADTSLEAVRAGRSTTRRLRRAWAKIAGCEEEFHRRVGQPDASRYRPGYDLVIKGCRSRARVAHKAIEAIDNKKALAERYVVRENARGDAFFEQARNNIEGALRANRPLPVVRGSRNESRIEPRLSRAASELLWRQPNGVEVRCWSVREWAFVEKEWAAYVDSGDLLGFVHTNVQRLSIAPDACALLARLVYRKDRPAEGVPLLKMAFSVGLLAHEAEHIVDYYDEETEATIECWAMQRIRWLARIMGASGSYGDLLARSYWARIYPLNSSKYHTRGCRDGTRLDKHPGTAVWP
jgi:hypothetical protein